MMFQSEKDAYEMYNTYAGNIGWMDCGARIQFTVTRE
jgi:hypothetical protein